MKKSPKQIVLDRFQSRENLVQEVLGLLGDDKDARTKARLTATRNEKLLSIHDALTTVKDKFGSKSDLISAIAEKKFDGRKPDSDYVTKLQGYTSKRLLDLHRQVNG